jgi:hypothetical protein
VCGGADLRDFYGRFSVTYPNISSFLEGTNCVTSLNPTSQNFSSAGGSGSFTVTAPGGCSWTAVPSDSFVTITPPANGTGNGSVNFSVASNSGPQRFATIVVGGQVFNITQGVGGACAPTAISIGQMVNGTLAISDCPLGDGSVYDAYSFNGVAGQQISILMTGDFDTYLFLNNPDASNLTQDDDGGGGTNSRIPPASGFITLPTTGTYTIFANAFWPADHTPEPGIGSYSLTLSGIPLVLKEEGTNNGVALDSVTFVRGPFKILNPNNFSADQHKRIVLFTSDLGLTQPNASLLSVQASGVNLPVENVGPLTGVAGLNGSYIIVRLPDALPTGDLQLSFTLRGLMSNMGTLSISP